jgi:hypothetical protein
MSNANPETPKVDLHDPHYAEDAMREFIARGGLPGMRTDVKTTKPTPETEQSRDAGKGDM